MDRLASGDGLHRATQVVVVDGVIAVIVAHSVGRVCFTQIKAGPYVVTDLTQRGAWYPRGHGSAESSHDFPLP
jgi:hypothetical protein